MIHGSVVNLRPMARVSIAAPGGPYVEVDCLVDTGFEGALALPADLVTQLGLPFFTGIFASLADGTDVSVDAHRADVLWEGRPLGVAVLAMGHQPLLGTSLLAGMELRAHFTEDGPVLVSPASDGSGRPPGSSVP
jgi:clan AA aspartic protease